MDISIPSDHFSINSFKKNKLIFSELFLKIFPFVISTFGEHLLGIFNFSNKFFKGGVHSVELTFAFYDFFKYYYFFQGLQIEYYYLPPFGDFFHKLELPGE